MASWCVSMRDLLCGDMSEGTFLILDRLEARTAAADMHAPVVTYRLVLSNVSAHCDSTTRAYLVTGTVMCYESVEHGNEASKTSPVVDEDYPVGGTVTLQVIAASHDWADLVAIR